jgi:hypothetical protein
MERQFTIDPAMDRLDSGDERARLIADKVGQVVHEVGRTMTAIIGDHLDKVVYKAAVSFCEWLESLPAGRPAKV